ncbi:MAG TPA: alpha-amylase family glycosyl hydrolase, partial [Anaerolineales bacterium]|nr:alpha-amylase family glycosyl hydrolase [Anaerolineales bacterium]
MSLKGAARDAWSWTASVQVEVSETDACEGLVVYVDGREFPAQPDGDTYTAEVNLSEGENRVHAVCLPSAGEAIESEPVVITERLRQTPKAMIQIEIENGQIVLDGSKSQTAEDGKAISEYLWSARDAHPEPLQLEDGALTGEVSGQTITIQPPAADGEYFVSLQVQDQEGRQDTSTSYFVVEQGQPRVPDYDNENPAWTEQAIVYGVIPFLFGSPAFDATTERLDDLADLGINTLWLGPINQHPADDYGYAVEDYFALDPAYGTEEDFRELVEAAHARDMRVIMDFVPNHTANTHPYFRDAQQNGQDSPYWDFYDRDEQGNYTHYFEWDHLPNLNYDNPEVRQMMVEAFSYWVREFDVDGFRVDVVWGVAERRA